MTQNFRMVLKMGAVIPFYFFILSACACRSEVTASSCAHPSLLRDHFAVFYARFYAKKYPLLPRRNEGVDISTSASQMQLQYDSAE